MDDLTPAQTRVLSFVSAFLAQHGYAPTLREIARDLGFSSTNAANEHLQMLQRKGHLRLEKGSRIARSIVLRPVQTPGDFVGVAELHCEDGHRYAALRADAPCPECAWLKGAS